MPRGKNEFLNSSSSCAAAAAAVGAVDACIQQECIFRWDIRANVPRDQEGSQQMAQWILVFFGSILGRYKIPVQL